MLDQEAEYDELQFNQHAEPQMVYGGNRERQKRDNVQKEKIYNATLENKRGIGLCKNKNA